MNPTQDIQRDIAPSAFEPPAGKPASGIASAPAQEQTRPKIAAESVPADLSNLAIGAGLLLSAFLIFWMGLYLANHVALRTLVASFGTFALVWVLYRLRIFHRPHGGLIVAGSVALFAAALPFIEHGFQKLDRAAQAGLAGEPARPAGDSAEGLPVPTRQRMSEPPVPTVPAPPEDDTIRELLSPALDANAGKIMRVMQDAKVSIGGHNYHISAGTQFPFTKVEDGIVTFRSGGQDVTIDSALVKLGGKSKETPEEIARLAGEELRRRYPMLADKSSPERQILDARITELKVEMPELFKNPRWPLEIGEQLAVQEGWKRADAPADESAPLAAESPADASKIPQPPIPPIPSDVPQEAPK